MYIPYILTCIGTIAMYYNMHALSVNKGIDQIYGGEQLKIVLSLGKYVIAIFSVIFLFYTNSFLIKRRKKEFGLFNILGMEKKHISRIMFYETLYIGIVSLIVGICSGMLFSKLFFLVLLRILHLKVQMGFEVSQEVFLSTFILFGIIFLLTFLNTLRQIHLSQPIELLKGGSVGEKEPKTKGITAIIGTICLGIGYYIALTTKSPLSALTMFFVTVILVIIGTYLLFTAGSIALLKILRKNKRYYYKTQHFTTVSGMIYRMKQNAVGLGNICILSTAVLVMISTTVSLYVGVEDVLRTRYPRNIILEMEDVSPKQAVELDCMIEEETDKYNAKPYNVVRYRSLSFILQQNGNSFEKEQESSNSYAGIAFLEFFTVSEYNEMMKDNITLKEDEMLLYEVYGKVPGDSIHFGAMEFHIKDRIEKFDLADSRLAMLVNTYYVVVPDMQTLEDIYMECSQEDIPMGELSYYYGFDCEGNRNTQIQLTNSMNNTLEESGYTGYAEGAEESRETFYALYGGLFFIGIFLGGLFLMATVLIIYYKQISEGYDDKERFEIMKKVGMSHSEIKKSIHSQVLTVFFLPLVTACIHLTFAFPIITKLLAVLNLTNVNLFIMGIIGTVLVFAMIYALIYALTARVYYKIIS